MNFETISLWLSQHPDWILGCIFGISLLESLAMVGLLSPGIALLFVAGTAAGSAHLSYWSILITAYSGAVMGDVLSYLLGARFHPHVVKMPPFKQHPEWLDKAEAFFRRYGLYGLFVGRFIGPLRPVLPMIAGALELPFVKFLLLDLCSGPLWAAVYLTPGYIVGSAAGAPAGGTQPLLLFLAGLLGMALVAAELLWRFLTRPRTAPQQALAGLTVLGLASVFMVTLFYTVLSHVADPINRWLALEAASLRHADADVFFIAFTGMGDMKPMVAWGVSVCAVLLLQRAWWPAIVWMFGTLSGNLIMHTMKHWLGVERPHLSQRVPDGFSFPSGHASMGLIFMGLITTLLWPGLSVRARRMTVYAAALYVVLMTSTRLYLGVHWTSDLLAGWALGAGLIALSWLILQSPPATLRASTARPRPLGVFAVTLAMWLGMGVFHIQPTLDDALQRYAPQLEASQLETPQLKASQLETPPLEAGRQP